MRSAVWVAPPSPKVRAAQLWLSESPVELLFSLSEALRKFGLRKKTWGVGRDLRSVHSVANSMGDCGGWLVRRMDTWSVGRRSDERLVRGDQRLPGISVFQEGDQSGAVSKSCRATPIRCWRRTRLSRAITAFALKASAARALGERRLWESTRTKGVSEDLQNSGASGGPSDGRPAEAVLALQSREPSFCEGHAGKAECANQTLDRFDATHFTLHGLWPQPRRREYCNVSQALIDTDRKGDWQALPEVNLDAARERTLSPPPGTQSLS